MDYRCYLTNNSRYDLKLTESSAVQFGLFHSDWAAQWDFSPPASIKSGQQAGSNPTLGTSVSGMDGNRTTVTWAVMHGTNTLGLVSVYCNLPVIGGSSMASFTTIPTIVYTWQESGHDPRHHRVTIGNWDYDDPDWHWP
jgi:hypothetical protein